MNESIPRTVARLNALVIRNKEFVFGKRTYVMGVVNVTPDSFSRDGVEDPQGAVAYALKQIEKGADLIDIGGQSTRPGHKPIDEEAEIKRIIPVITALRKASDVVISVDTFSPVVLETALAAGADILNSIWGLTDDLLPIVKQKKLPVIIMHNKPASADKAGACGVGAHVSAPVPLIRNDGPRTVGARLAEPCSANLTEPTNESNAINPCQYPNGVVNAVVDYLSNQANKALAAGLRREQIILDPGIGFGKTADQNIEILSQFEKIYALGFPTLIGTSRKSTIGKLTDRPVDQRVFGTAATVAFAITKGVDIVRVHDVGEIVDVVKISDALARRWRPQNWVNQ